METATEGGMKGGGGDSHGNSGEEMETATEGGMKGGGGDSHRNGGEEMERHSVTEEYVISH